jgi:glycerophosphoryl diester phosphodiesterase
MLKNSDMSIVQFLVMVLSLPRATRLAANGYCIHNALNSRPFKTKGLSMSAQPQLKIIGHRGAAGLLPENTLASFSRAVELGVDAVELDVHAWAGKLWVIHDHKLDRTTSGTGPLSRYSLEQLRKLDAGNGAQIPFLEEVFTVVPESIPIHIELKGKDTAAPVADFLARTAARDVLVSSFDHQELARFQNLAPDQPVAPLFDRWRGDPVAVGVRFASRYINLSRKITTEARCRQIISAGFQILVYTVNDPADAASLLAMGVKGVFTDYPDRLRAAFPALKADFPALRADFPAR